MKKFLIASLFAATALFAEEAPKVGVVNFGSCLNESKYGKQEQASFESTRKQMMSLIEDTEKQVREISDKFNDKDYMDSLSPTAEEEMKGKFRTLSEELGRYQQQFYTVMQQAQMKVLQAIGGYINDAAEKVASHKKLTMVVNKELCFFHAPALDITSDVIKEMDKKYEVDPKAISTKPADAGATSK